MRKTKQELLDDMVRDLKNWLYNKKVKRKERIAVFVYIVGLCYLGVVNLNSYWQFPGSKHIFWIYLAFGWLPIVLNIKFKVSEAETNKKLKDFVKEKRKVYLENITRCENNLAELEINITKAEEEKDNIVGCNIWRTRMSCRIMENDFLNNEKRELSLIDEILADLE